MENNIFTYRNLKKANEIFGLSVEYFLALVFTSLMVVTFSYAFGFLLYGILGCGFLVLVAYLSYSKEPRFFQIFKINLFLTPNLISSKEKNMLCFEDGGLGKDHLKLMVQRRLVLRKFNDEEA